MVRRRSELAAADRVLEVAAAPRAGDAADVVARGAPPAVPGPGAGAVRLDAVGEELRPLHHRLLDLPGTGPAVVPGQVDRLDRRRRGADDVAERVLLRGPVRVERPFSEVAADLLPPVGAPVPGAAELRHADAEPEDAQPVEEQLVARGGADFLHRLRAGRRQPVAQPAQVPGRQPLPGEDEGDQLLVAAGQLHVGKPDPVAAAADVVEVAVEDPHQLGDVALLPGGPVRLPEDEQEVLVRQAQGPSPALPVAGRYVLPVPLRPEVLDPVLRVVDQHHLVVEQQVGQVDDVVRGRPDPLQAVGGVSLFQADQLAAPLPVPPGQLPRRFGEEVEPRPPLLRALAGVVNPGKDGGFAAPLVGEVSALGRLAVAGRHRRGHLLQAGFCGIEEAPQGLGGVFGGRGWIGGHGRVPLPGRILKGFPRPRRRWPPRSRRGPRR